MFVGVHRFLPALCVFRGARFAEVRLSHRARRHGVSKYGVSNRLWRGLADLWRRRVAQDAPRAIQRARA